MRKILRWVLPIAAVLGCIYIWHFSLADGETSAITSRRAWEMLNGILQKIGIQKQFTHRTVRKMGHFLGYFILGFFAALTLWVYRVRHPLWVGTVICFAAACVDECIQIFSPGRVASVSDVLLDTAGAVCGILLFSLPVRGLIRIFDRRNKKIAK